MNIAQVLGVSLDWFYDGAQGSVAISPSPEVKEVAAFMASVDGLIIARTFMRIDSPRVRKAIAKFVTDMAALDRQAAG